MSNPGLWIQDPDTGEERFVYYHELDQDIVQSFIKPVGGFVFPADLFVLSKLPPVPFYVQNWLPKRGKAMLYAPPKCGKSFLAMQLARCVASGEPFLGLPTNQGVVLYLQFELGEEVLQGRLRQTGKSYDRVYVGTSFSMKLDKAAEQKRLWRALGAVEPDVLILDPWYKILSGDENESSDVMAVLDFQDSVIEGFNCSVFIVHHAGKDITKRGRGSSVLEDWVDTCLQMRKISKRGEPLRVQIEPVFLRHAQIPPEPIKAELGEDFEFHLMEASPTIKQQVLEFFRGNPALAVAPRDLFDKKLGSNTSVYQALKDLVAEAKIQKLERGEYVLARTE
jgi:hypothetical protein